MTEKPKRRFIDFEEIIKNQEKHILLGNSLNKFSFSKGLMLSPHLSSNTPYTLKANTVTESAFKFLLKEEEYFERNKKEFDFDPQVFEIDKITTQEYDLDSLIAIFVLLEPNICLKQKKLLIDIANYSKYDNVSSPKAQDIIRVVSSLKFLLEKNEKEGVSKFKVFQSLLKEFPLIFHDIFHNQAKTYLKYSEAIDLKFQNSLLLLKKSLIRVEAIPCLDLNIFHFFPTPSLSHILSSQNKNILYAPIHSSTHPLFISLFIFGNNFLHFSNFLNEFFF